MYGCFSVAPRPGEEREGTSYFFVIDKKIILSLFRETMSSKNEQKLEFWCKLRQKLIGTKTAEYFEITPV
jgi:hypothetical protein